MTVLWTACGASSTTPTGAISATVRVTHLSVTGKAALSAVGETSQLMATATFSDGSLKDVSSTASWWSTDVSVMTVSSTGLVTVVRLGTTTIYAQFQQTTFLSVTATVPGTFVMAGVAQEPGQGDLAGLRVVDAASSLSTQTNQLGLYSLAPVATRQTHLRFEKDGYEPVELDATADKFADVRVQHIVRLVAGETVTPPRLAPNDLTYIVAAGKQCASCRLIRVVVPVKGTVHIRLTWPNDCVVTLGLWIGSEHVGPLNSGNTEVNTDIAADAGETIFYVDRASPATTSCHVPFTLETSVTY